MLCMHSHRVMHGQSDSMPVQLLLVLVGCCCVCTYTCVVGWHLSLAWFMRHAPACQCLGHSSSFVRVVVG